MPFDPSFAPAIASIESGGNYSILGPETKGDRAYGKYQIMGNNIATWSKEILGFEMSPQQFLENPQAQDAIFQGKFGQYVDKYGPEGASKAWFAGERGMNNPNAKDVLGTSVQGYASKFMKALGQPVLGQAPQMTAGAPQAGPMPAYGWSPNNAPTATAASPQSQFDAPSQPQMPEMAQMPLLGGPRRPPDLTQLRALLARAPAQSRGFSFLRT